VDWEQGPDAIKQEYDILMSNIFGIKQIADLSFEKLKGLDLSGVAYDRVLMDSHLMAKDYQNGPYGEGIQRRLNFILKAITALPYNCKDAYKLEITPEFGLFKIDDQTERISNAVKLLSGGVGTLQQAVEMAGVSDDVDATVTEINNEADKKAKEAAARAKAAGPQPAGE
jgi:hypothetical protein